MGYVPYFLLLLGAEYALGYLVRYPWTIAVAVVLVVVARRRLPNVYLYIKHLRRVRALKLQIAANPENATARRDLARIWLEKRRPRRAVPLLEEALRRDRDSLELRLLLGQARLEAGQPEPALAPLVEVAARDERHGRGEAYLLAGRALYKLKRDAEAEDALERFVSVSSSTVEGRVRLAAVKRELRNRRGAEAALRDARETYRTLPAFRRRKEIGWYLRAVLMGAHLL